MHNILTSISLEQSVQLSLQLDVKESRKKGQKHTIDSVRGYFSSLGYELTSLVYVNCSKKLDYICPVGHSGSSNYYDFRQGHRCFECSGKKKHTYSSVKATLESANFQLISTEYLNHSTALDYICPFGHSGSITYKSWNRGHRCAVCSRKKKHEYLDVKEYFAKFGYTLISTEYKNSKTKLAYLCPVGHKGSISFGNFTSGGDRCDECYHFSQRRTMLSGEDWKPSSRMGREDNAWKKAVKKRDGYTCQGCFFPSKKLHAHHIESYAKNIELRNDLTNGVTLCEPCHNAFHSQYGKMTATRQNLEEFTRFKCG